MNLAEKIKKKTAKIAVIGLGYVGLPLAVSFAKKGYKVTGIDTDKDRVYKTKRAISYILDVDIKDIKKTVGNKRLVPTADFRSLKDADVVLICVPTPIKGYQPDISYIKGAVKEIARFLKKDMLIILESTTYPGTTEEVIAPMLEKGGLKCGEDFYLAFSPERIDPGNPKYQFENIPKVVGGITKEAALLVKLLYEQVIVKVVPVSSTKVAETVKLLENTFRIVNIGLVNELAMMCEKMKLDIWEVIDAAKTKPFGFMPFYPGPGVGGHCIPKDPLYLYWKAKLHGFKSKYIKLASDTNNFMPEYVTQRIRRMIGKSSLRGARILVMGVTYKKDVKDLRKSPALDIINILHKKGADVLYHDSLIPYLRINSIDHKSVKPTQALLKTIDCAVITADHSDVDYEFIAKHSRIVFDTRNVYKNYRDFNGKVVRL